MIGTRKCFVWVLILPGFPVRSTWFDMWGFAVAIEGMCVRHGRMGQAMTEDGKMNCGT